MMVFRRVAESWIQKITAFLGLIILICAQSSCENQSANRKIDAAENMACMVVLNNAFSSFLTALSEGKNVELISDELDVQFLDTLSGNPYHVVNYYFGTGTECKDGFRRSGIWQVQYNKNNIRLADTIILFLQKINPDSIQINSGVGWKGNQLLASGVVTLTKTSLNTSKTSIALQWQSENFLNISNLIVLRTVKSESNNIKEYSIEVSGISRIVSEQSINAVVSSQQLTHRDNCWKGIEAGIITISDKTTPNQQYSIQFNPFGSTPAPCDEHAKLEIDRIEKMFTLW